MEYLDIVDEKDAIISPNVAYEEVHAGHSRHRAVHIILINDSGELLLQLRSEKKSAFPLHWTFSAGGHVRHGESYPQALVREVKEELDIDMSEDAFIEKGEGVYGDQLGHKIFYKTYQTFYDKPIEVIANEEVTAVQFVSWETLKKMIAYGEEKVHPELVEILKRHWSDYL